MIPVLIANAIWVVLLLAWGILLFAQAKRDQKAGRDSFDEPIKYPGE